MESITTPKVLKMPFANEGDKNDIPVLATGSQLASFEEGFPVITQTAIAEGGIPPERNDFNGILNIATQFYFAFQNGWHPTFDSETSTTIGGYPLGAILWYGTGNYYVKSLVANNTYNFNENAGYIGTYWEKITASSAELEQYYPIGGLVAFAGNEAPNNYLICDGSAVSRSDYAQLFSKIGVTYGVGDGSTTFNLPNFVNRTFWGGTTSGAVKEAGLPNINGTINYVRGVTTTSYNFSGAFSNSVARTAHQNMEDRQNSSDFTMDFDASRSSPIYGRTTTVQPPAVQTLICIKYQ